jgi:hypothetical protein
MTFKDLRKRIVVTAAVLLKYNKLAKTNPPRFGIRSSID